MIKKSFFKNKNILITGGTGSLGRELVSYFIKEKFPFKKIIILSRDELKQSEMKSFFPIINHKTLRFFLGDVRDKERLITAFEDVDFVIHAAALKQVEASEYNPIEFIKTNIIGAQNVIEAAIASRRVQTVIALSTDKASSPINLYGATKLCSDKLFINANNMVGNSKVKFCVVRYGNVMGSRGSVLNNFLKQKKEGTLLLTHPDMTRFHITLKEAIEMIMWSMIKGFGGEIFIPKIPSFYIKDLARAVCDDCVIKVIGKKSGEKIHEEMISLSDSSNTYDLGKYYAVLPEYLLNKYEKKYLLVSKNFSYTSQNNKEFLSIRNLAEIIKKNFLK